MEVRRDISAGPVELAILHIDGVDAEYVDRSPVVAIEGAAGAAEIVDDGGIDLERLDAGTLTSLIAVGAVILTAAGFILVARGGNYKVVRKNLQDAGKANAKQAMPEKQRVLRRRKRKKS